MDPSTRLRRDVPRQRVARPFMFGQRSLALGSAESLHHDLSAAVAAVTQRPSSLVLGLVSLLGAENISHDRGPDHVVDLLERAERTVGALADIDHQLTAYRLSPVVIGLILSDTTPREAVRIGDVVCHRIRRDAPGLTGLFAMADLAPHSARRMSQARQNVSAAVEDLYSRAWKAMGSALDEHGFGQP